MLCPQEEQEAMAAAATAAAAAAQQAAASGSTSGPCSAHTSPRPPRPTSHANTPASSAAHALPGSAYAGLLGSQEDVQLSSGGAEGVEGVDLTVAGTS